MSVQQSESRGSAVRPPGPSGFRWSGNLAAYEADRLGFLLRSREQFGGLVTFDVGTTLVHDPALAAEVLRDRSGAFDIRVDLLNRPVGAVQAAARLADRRDVWPSWQGVNPGELPWHGREWLGQLAADTALVEFAGLTEKRQPAEHQTDLEPFDPTPALERSVGQALARFYFGQEAAGVAGEVRALLDALAAVFGNVWALPASWPTPSQRRVRRCYRRLRSRVEAALGRRLRSIESEHARRASGQTAGVVPDMLTGIAHRLAAAPDGGVSRASHAVVGALIAGYRVPAAAAAWTLLELARRPELQQAIRAESERVGDSPRSRRRDSLLERIICETTRLHPPTWLVRRTASRSVTLGGYRFEPGSQFLISPYVIHRDPAIFASPDQFDPERWQRQHGQPLPLTLTFGHGPHRCPGAEMAICMLGAQIGALLHRWDFVLAGASHVTPNPRSTLVPDGLRLIAVSRLTSGSRGEAVLGSRGA